MKTFKGNCESLLSKGYKVNYINLAHVGHTYIGFVYFIKQTSKMGCEKITVWNNSSKESISIENYNYLWESEKEKIIPNIRSYRDIVTY